MGLWKTAAWPGVVIFTTTMLTGGTAWAQTADATGTPVAGKPAPAVKPKADPPKGGGLQEVVVTATRRPEKDQNVPVSTSVITPEQINAIFSAGGDARALAATVPSLNVESSNGRTFPRFYIRGYGNSDFNTFASQPVSLVYDEVDQENPVLKGFPIFDVADIEVLRGPQGTLFGRNAPAGVVNVQSARPSLDAFSQQYSVSDATFNTADFQGMINAPINSDLAVRLSVQEQHRDNWVHDAINGTDINGYSDFGGRLQLLYQKDGFSALFNVHGRKLDGNSQLFRANIIEPGTDNLVPGFSPYKIFTDGRNTQTLGTIGSNARLSWDLGPVTLFSITGFEKILNYFTEGDIDGGFGASFLPTMGPTVTTASGKVIGIPFPVETGGGITDHDQVTQELRAQSNYKGPLNWLVGGYYFYETVTSPNQDYDMLGNTITDFNVSRQINTALAAFGSLDYKPIRHLELRGGMRYTYDDKHFKILQIFNQTIAGNHSATALGHNLSGDFNATYGVVRNVNLYGRFATGFRAPSFGAPSAFVGIQVAQAETNTSGEIGVKSYLFDHRAKLDFDIYYFDVSGQQLTVVGGSDDSTRLINAKNTIGKGAELNFETKLAENLAFTVNASYNFTRIEDPSISVAVCAACTVTNAVNALGNATLDGNSLSQAPRWIVDPSLEYSYPIGSTKEVFLYSDLAYRSSIDFFLYRSREFIGQPFANLGVRAGYRWGAGKYELAAFCRNCLDQIRTVGGIDFNNLTGYINDPAIVGAQLSVKL